MFTRSALWLLPRLGWVTFLVIILVWVVLVEGGFGFNEASVFGWHALFMTLGFVVFMGESLLAYNAPLLQPLASFSKQGNSQISSPIVKKSFHVIWHLLTLVCAVLGLVGIVYYKKLSNKPVQFPFFTMYSVHSWVGVCTLVLWGLQFITKAWHNFMVDARAKESQSFLNFHRYLGRCVFVSGLATAALGLQDMQSSDLAGLGYGPFSAYSELASAGGLILLFFGMSVFATVMVLRQDSGSKGISQDEEIPAKMEA